MIPVLQTFIQLQDMALRKKQSGSKNDINATWKHSEAVTWNVSCWTFFSDGWSLRSRCFLKDQQANTKGMASVLSGQLELHQLTNPSSTLQPNSKSALSLMSVYVWRFNSISLSFFSVLVLIPAFFPTIFSFQICIIGHHESVPWWKSADRSPKKGYTTYINVILSDPFNPFYVRQM